MIINQKAPELTIDRWVNTSENLSEVLHDGKVVALHVFQMLCPGCVSHGIPQAQKMYEMFPPEHVTVIGLHSVFEHHRVMTPDALNVFIHEYRLKFPIAVDKPAPNSPIPCTMQRYGLRGTPTLILIDKQGVVRLNHFGRLEDMLVGNIVGQLVSERHHADEQTENQSMSSDEKCSSEGCLI